MSYDEPYTFNPIGIIHSCYKQKFGIPRQPGLVKQATAELIINTELSKPEVFRGIEQYSHLWLIFVFHQSIRKSEKITVRPPRLGGKEKLGVFATRSNFRPNPIGQSVVKFEGIDTSSKQYVLKLSGGDLLHETPILDLKPYIPYADVIIDAVAGFASQPPEKLYQVSFSEDVLQQIDSASIELNTKLKPFISELLSYDPRPAFFQDKHDGKSYAMYLYNRNLQWNIVGNRVQVIDFSTI